MADTDTDTLASTESSGDPGAITPTPRPPWWKGTLAAMLRGTLALGLLMVVWEAVRIGFDFDPVLACARRIDPSHRGVGEEQGAC
mgnify:CR=1 FL=1